MYHSYHIARADPARDIGRGSSSCVMAARHASLAQFVRNYPAFIGTASDVLPIGTDLSAFPLIPLVGMAGTTPKSVAKTTSAVAQPLVAISAPVASVAEASGETNPASSGETSDPSETRPRVAKPGFANSGRKRMQIRQRGDAMVESTMYEANLPVQLQLPGMRRTAVAAQLAALRTPLKTAGKSSSRHATAHLQRFVNSAQRANGTDYNLFPPSGTAAVAAPARSPMIVDAAALLPSDPMADHAILSAQLATAQRQSAADSAAVIFANNLTSEATIRGQGFHLEVLQLKAEVKDLLGELQAFRASQSSAITPLANAASTVVPIVAAGPLLAPPASVAAPPPAAALPRACLVAPTIDLVPRLHNPTARPPPGQQSYAVAAGAAPVTDVNPLIVGTRVSFTTSVMDSLPVGSLRYAKYSVRAMMISGNLLKLPTESRVIDAKRTAAVHLVNSGAVMDSTMLYDMTVFQLQEDEVNLGFRMNREQLQHRSAERAAEASMAVAQVERDSIIAQAMDLSSDDAPFQSAPQHRAPNNGREHNRPQNGEVRSSVSVPDIVVGRDAVDTIATAVPSRKSKLGHAKPAAPDYFRGSATDKIAVWLGDMSNYLTQCNTDPDSWVGVAHTFIKGQAATVWSQKCARLDYSPDWNAFKSIMTLQYGSIDPDRVAREQILTVSQGTLSAKEFDRNFRSIMNDIDGMDERSLIILYVKGLRLDLQDKCSFNRKTGLPWTNFDDVSNQAVLEDASLPLRSKHLMSSVHHSQGPTHHTSAARTGLKRPALNAMGAAPRGPPSEQRSAPMQPGRIQTGGQHAAPRNDSFRVADVPKQPNSPQVLAEFKRRGLTKNVPQWKRTLAEFKAHAHSHGVCNRCAQKHVIGQCQVVNDEDWIIFPLLKREQLGPMGR